MVKKIITILVIYCVAIIFIFSYLLFPRQVLKNKLESIVSQRFSANLSINDISLRFPASIIMKKARITFNPKNSTEKPASMDLDELKVRFNFLALFTGNLGIKLDILMGNGAIKAKINRKWIGAPLKHFFCSLSALPIQDISAIGQQLGILMTGTTKAEIDIKWTGNDITKGIGTWSFNIDKGRIMPSRFPSFEYDSIVGKGFIKEQLLQIEGINIQGQDISLIATGHVRLSPTINSLYIDTQLRMKLLPKLKKRLDFLSGFLPQPDSEGFIHVNLYGPPNGLHFVAGKGR